MKIVKGKKRTRKNNSALAAAVILSCTLLLHGPLVISASADAKDEMPTVSVSAECSVTVTPDMAEILLSVTDEAADATEAQRMNAEKVNAVIETLTALGIEEKSICTTGYDMYPNYDYDEYQKIVGYTVVTSMKISDLKIEDVGGIVNSCVQQGINGISGIRYTCSDYDTAYQEALASAVAQARETAQTIAQAAGKELGDIVTITEEGQDTSYRYNGLQEEKALLADQAAGAAEYDMAVMPGEAQITASVSACWYMN